MNKSRLNEIYGQKKIYIEQRLAKFQNLPEESQLKELIFCLLTPQSNAKSCWQAVEALFKENKWNKESIASTLKSKTRFHNNKSRYVAEAKNSWSNIKAMLNGSNPKNLRNTLADNVKGYGLKEASHFLRNIGKSDNQIAILDRHILNNLQQLGVIKEAKIKNNKNYLEIEQAFLKFSKDAESP